MVATHFGSTIACLTHVTRGSEVIDEGLMLDSRGTLY